MITVNIFNRIITAIKSIPAWITYGSPLKQDESVIFFPSCANKLSDGSWHIPVRAWVFELEENTLLRKLASHTIAEFLEAFDITEEQAHSPVFKERIKWFLADNERNKRIALNISGEAVTMPRSSANGHSRLTFRLDDNHVKDWHSFQRIYSSNSTKIFSGDIEFVPEYGLSVISDIDDTIKISEVTDKYALLQNIFFNEYETVPGMPELYQRLLNMNASFHYISASPWSLYPSLKPFLDKNYPMGSILLRHFRATDSSFIKFFMSSKGYKTDAIRYMIRRFPHREFILIGDSGEKDPKIYAKIYAEFPDSVSQILIRHAPGAIVSKGRLEKVFEKVPDEKWMLFTHPDEIVLRV